MPSQPRADVLLDDIKVENIDAVAILTEVINRIIARRQEEGRHVEALIEARRRLEAQAEAHAELRRHREQFMRRATRERAWDGSFDRREADRRRELGMAA